MITRSKKSIIIARGGVVTRFASSLEDGGYLAFQYWIEKPNGGWHEFDIRSLGIEISEPGDILLKMGIAARLTYVASLLSDDDVFGLFDA